MRIPFRRTTAGTTDRNVDASAPQPGEGRAVQPAQAGRLSSSLRRSAGLINRVRHRHVAETANCPVNVPNAVFLPASEAATAGLPTVAAPQPREDFTKDLRVLQDWVVSAPLEEHGDRVKIGELFRKCWENPDIKTIAIGEPRSSREGAYNSLSSLPPIPSKLETIRIIDCAGLITPPDISKCDKLKAIKLVRCTRLIAPPDISTCTQLKALELNECSALTTAPDLSHCDQLEKLDIWGCQALTAAPDLSACTKLTDLSISFCHSLIAPPDISHCRNLKHLNLSGCPNILTAPDWAQCPDLQAIELMECDGITTLPRVSHLSQLRELSAPIPITSLPEDIFQLPQDCDVLLNLQRLSDAVRNRLMATMNASHYTGPCIYFNLGDASVTPVQRPVGQEVAAWHAEASSFSQSATDQAVWSNLPLQDNITGFSTFLARIRETNDYRSTPALKAATQQRVVTLLNQLQTDADLREDCCNLALDAVNTCGDRVAIRLMDMEMLALEKRTSADIEAGKYDVNPKALVELCKGQYRLQLLADQASKKVAGMNFVDEIEVRLGYLVGLTEKYAMPVQISTMLYPACSGVTAADLTDAERKLSSDQLSTQEKESNDCAYQQFLAGSALMRCLLARLSPQGMATANAGNAQSVEEGEGRIREQLERLDPAATDFRQRSNQLMQAFHACKKKVPVQATQPLLLAFLKQQGISASL